VEEGGIEAWQRVQPSELLGPDDAAQYDKIKDTLDVWFDSGSTHFTVMGGPDGAKTGAGSHGALLKFPADLYLEGSDQHRGWFHSSLLVSCMMNGEPPYKALLTHGFVVDGHGRKMSKSMGNVIAPQKVSDTLGAEILRLWVASTDYSGELSISDEILKRVVESYRRIRNTLRFLMANTADFDSSKDMLPAGEWTEIDRYVISLTAQLQQELSGYYDRYEFHLAVQRLQSFCSEDLGAFYLDVLKDRLYTTATASAARRSAQSALWHITQCLLRLMAPILSFTAEEAWAIAGDGSESVQLQTWHVLPAIAGQDALMQRWSTIRSVRADVQRELEQLRAAGKIGSSLQAAVTVRVSGGKFDALAALKDDLRFVLITSQAVLERAASEQDEAINAAPSSAVKCERCWHYRDDVGSHADHPGICGRCVDNLAGAGEVRRHA
jgi:isoleucyl-tRNA synthetase